MLPPVRSLRRIESGNIERNENWIVLFFSVTTFRIYLRTHGVMPDNLLSIENISSELAFMRLPGSGLGWGQAGGRSFRQLKRIERLIDDFDEITG